MPDRLCKAGAHLMLIQCGCSSPKEFTGQVWYIGAHDDSLRNTTCLAPEVAFAWAQALSGFTGRSRVGLQPEAEVYLACACAKSLLEGGPHTLPQVAGLVLRYAL